MSENMVSGASTQETRAEEREGGGSNELMAKKKGIGEGN